MKISCRVVMAFLLASLSFASDIPKNTKLEVRTTELLSSDRSMTGQRFTATLTRSVSAGGVVLLEKGALVEGVVKLAEPTYNYQQPGELDLELVAVTSGGKRYSLQTNTVMLAGRPSAVDPRTGRPMDRGSRTGDVIAGTIGGMTGGSTAGPTTTIPGTDVSVGAGSARQGTQVILPPKSKLNFVLLSATVAGSSSGNSQ